MRSGRPTAFGALVEHYLGDRLAPDLADRFHWSDLPPETKAFVRRMLSLMRRARYPAVNLTPHLIQWLTTMVPAILPGAWKGRIPPITMPRRHHKLDQFVLKGFQPAGSKPPLFVDLGCGFPPLTTADTANSLPEWRVVGVDISFAAYILYDGEGHYACFDHKGAFLYFQAMLNGSRRSPYATPEKTRRRFKKHFQRLRPLLDASRDPDSERAKSERAKSERAHLDGYTLIRHHIRDYETDRLSFIEADMEDLSLPPAAVIRCMNLLVYFNTEARLKMIGKAGGLLAEDGVFIAGTNGLGIQSRYYLFRKEATAVIPEAFAFSLDNLGPVAFMPWFTLHADDPEADLLADLGAHVRASHTFWRDFSGRSDHLMAQLGMCRRETDGYLVFPGPELPLDIYLQRNRRLWRQMTAEGYLEGVVGVLRAAGYKAWRNSIDDIAIRPQPAEVDWLGPALA